LIQRAKALAPDMLTKSGFMVGLGETLDETLSVMCDLRNHGCDIVTVGQYLQPTKQHLPVERYWHPDEFAAFRNAGRELGFTHVEAGPLVRSSYHAGEQSTGVLDVSRPASASNFSDLIPLRQVPRG
jgi:lipoic acid synthetase